MPAMTWPTVLFLHIRNKNIFICNKSSAYLKINQTCGCIGESQCSNGFTKSLFREQLLKAWDYALIFSPVKVQEKCWMLKQRKWDIEGRWEKRGGKKRSNQKGAKEAERFKRWLEQPGKRRINIGRKESWVIWNYSSKEKKNQEIVSQNKRT